MKNIIVLSLTLFFSIALFGQNNIIYKNQYEVKVLNIETEETAKITIGHLRKITNTKRCDFDNNNNTFTIKTNSKVTELYLSEELTKRGCTLLSYTIIHED
ncbi:MAG: hypothetical protein ACPGSO_06395 [Vicingaceae bacterium]